MQLQREALRRGLWRASLASILVLLVVVALALGLAWKADQFQTEAERARIATERAEAELWNSKLNEARARRIAGGPGARVQSAASVRELVKRPDLNEAQTLALRQEAIAQLALVDLDLGTNWVTRDRPDSLFWNQTFTQFVKARSVGRITVQSYPGEDVVRRLEAYTNAVLLRAVFSPAGDLVAASFRDGQIRVWRIADGALLLSTEGSESSNHIQPFFSPDGRLLGVISSRTNWSRGDGMRLYDLGSGELRLQYPMGPTFAQISPDGRHLAAVFRAEVRLLSLTNGGKTVASFKLPSDEHARAIWHPEGQRLAISCGKGRLMMWDPWPGSNTRTFPGHPNAITDLAFSSDGSLLLSHGWDSIANFWDPISGRRLLAENRVGIHAFNPAGNVMAEISRDRREGEQRLLSRTGFRTVASTGNAAQSTAGVWIDPSGRLVASAYPQDALGNGVRVWKFPHGEELARLPGEWAQFTPDGRALLTFSVEAVRRFEIPSPADWGTAAAWRAQVIHRPEGDRAMIKKGMIAADGKTLVIGEDQFAVLFDLTGERAPRRFKAPAQHGSMSPDGQWLITSKHQEPGGRLLNVSTGAKVRSVPVPAQTWAEFSPDGRYAILLDATTLKFYQTETWECVRQIPLEVGAGTPPAFSFTADGQMFAVAYNRQDVRLHDTASGRELATLSPPDPVPITGGSGLAFSSNARWLIAARNDGDLVAWELPAIRTELAKLGLDWGAQVIRNPLAGRASVPASRLPSAPLAGLLAAIFAIAAGSFIFLMQRRMIAGYERVEAVTVEQRGKLHVAQDELVHSQKMRALGTLAAGIAHDFNNLLSVIRLSNQLAAEETKPKGAAKENMDAVESAVAQGEMIVQSMLGYSRAGAELDKEYSVAAALSETVAMLGKKFLSGIVLKLEVEPNLPPVQGARGRLEQMLLNLVVNAAEAMKGQGTLALTARLVDSCPACVLQPRPAENFVEVTVSDSGPGISPDILPRIFEPFFTTKNAGATPGTGLGLSTVYTMAEQDGLGLGVDTGKGTTFRIAIPVRGHDFGF